jgi:hypothetical protein
MAFGFVTPKILSYVYNKLSYIANYEVCRDGIFFDGKCRFSDTKICNKLTTFSYTLLPKYSVQLFSSELLFLFKYHIAQISL